MNRREALRSMAGCGAMLLSGRAAAAETKRSRMGIVIYALGLHQRHAGLSSPMAFLEKCHGLGAGGIQCAFGPKDASQAIEVRKRAEQFGMNVEAIINPPRDDGDLARFERDVILAKEAGAGVARTVIMPGRRYEQFKTLQEFRQSEGSGLKSLQLAGSILDRHRFRLAVENHKDQLIAEKLDTLQRVGSEWIGLCVDVANNIALMEDPLETARAFAPFAFTVHIKDLAAKEYADGWLLADVALGDGFLPLKQIVDVLRAAKPGVKFNLETITREPIKLPVRTDAFWATLPGERAEALGRVSSIVKAKSGVNFPADVSKQPIERQLLLEQATVERSLAYAMETLL